MRSEEIYFYKLMLLCGYPEELNQAISSSLENQNPIDPDILDLSACGSDAKKQLSVLNAILVRDGEESLDRKAIYELVRRFLHQQYAAGMDIPALVKLMYRIATETCWYDEEPWNTLFLMEDYYDDAQCGCRSERDFLHLVETLIGKSQMDQSKKYRKIKLSKRFVLAQVLYYMALRDKTQKQTIVWGKKKQELFDRLTMYHQIVGWLSSDEALHTKQCKELLEYIQDQNHAFPRVNSDILSELCALNYQIECDRGLVDDEIKAIEKMVYLLHYPEHIISRKMPCSNITWIETFMAFHNLPRIFFGSELLGLWDEPILHVDLSFALEAASYFDS